MTLFSFNAASEKKTYDPFFSHRLEDPYLYLGLQLIDQNTSAITAYFPYVEQLEVKIENKIYSMTKVDVRGIFYLEVDKKIEPSAYQICFPNKKLFYDPYAFNVQLDAERCTAFSEGKSQTCYQWLGSHIHEIEGITGVLFTIWAPEASKVALIGDFNEWDGRIYPMKKNRPWGIWSLFIPLLFYGAIYQYEIHDQQGKMHVCTDPLAPEYERRPKTGAIIKKKDSFQWTDQQWMKNRIKNSSLWKSFYHVHLGSWFQEGRCFLNYRKLAHRLQKHCQSMEFTHVLLMPLAEYLMDESLGYSPFAYYAVTSRYGALEDFQYFVNYLHEHGIGVVMEWPIESIRYCFKHADSSNTAFFPSKPKKSAHFFDSPELVSLFYSNAHFWLCQMHLDGLKLTNLPSLWASCNVFSPYCAQNPVSLQASVESFLQNFNRWIDENFAGVMMLTDRLDKKKYPSSHLGFDGYFDHSWKDIFIRCWGLENIDYKRGLCEWMKHFLQVDNKKNIFALTHNLFCYSPWGLMSYIPGKREDKLAYIRMLYTYLFFLPGHKMMFMGAEILQWTPWDYRDSLHWYYLEEVDHLKIKQLIYDLNLLYQNYFSLCKEHNSMEISFLPEKRDCDTFAYTLTLSSVTIICLHHFGDQPIEQYEIHFPVDKKVITLIHTGDVKYGGTYQVREDISILQNHEGTFDRFCVYLPPLTTFIFQVY